MGWPKGAHGSGTSIFPTNVSDDVWEYPYAFTYDRKPVQLYGKPSPRVSIFLGEQPAASLKVFGLNEPDRRYADVLMENNYFSLWGFADGPRAMTTAGRELFVNTAYRTLR
jgi:hypothetical protein